MSEIKNLIQYIKTGPARPEIAATMLAGPGVLLVIFSSILIVETWQEVGDRLDPAVVVGYLMYGHLETDWYGTMLFLSPGPLIGSLFIISGIGVFWRRSWGLKLARISFKAAGVAVALIILIAPVFIALTESERGHSAFIGYIMAFLFFACFAFALLALPASLVALYLNRLDQAEPEAEAVPENKSTEAGSDLSSKYVFAPIKNLGPLPPLAWGLLVPIVWVLLLVLVSDRFFPLLGIYFIALYLFQSWFINRPTPFEKVREVREHFDTGRQGAGFFKIRLLVYDDGVEARLYFKAFFIPYDLMEEPVIEGGRRPSLVIIGQAPGTPDRIYFGLRSSTIFRRKPEPMLESARDIISQRRTQFLSLHLAQT